MSSFRKISESDPLRVVVVGQTPPPFHGQGIMLERLVRSQMQSVSIHHVRMAFSESMDDVGRFQIGKLFHLVSVIVQIVFARITHRGEVLYYPPAGPNRVPVYRDLIILLSTRWMFRKTVFHFQAGGVSTLQDELSPWMRRLFEWAYFNADGAVRLSELTPEDGAGLRAKREFIIPNCAEDERDRFLATEEKRDASQTKPLRILYLGTVCRTKGMLVLLDACRRLKERSVPFHLEVVGSFQPADFVNEVGAALEENGLVDCVTLAGQQTGDAKFERLAAADIFCFPTHYESEAFPCVVVEAMSFGLPVVSTEWRGVPSIVDHGRTGLLAPPQDAEAIAKHLSQLAQDASMRHAMGEAGRVKYTSEFTTERHLELMEAMFVSVGEQATGAPRINGSSVEQAAESV